MTASSESDDRTRAHEPPRENPFAAPVHVEGPITALERTERPYYELYSLWSVVLATFIGSLIAGSVLLAINYRRIGRAGAGRTAIAIGAIATLAVIIVTQLMPDQVPSALSTFPQLVVVYLIATRLQGDILEQHERAFGPLSSPWGALGIGLIFLILIAALAFAIELGQFWMQGKLDHAFR